MLLLLVSSNERAAGPRRSSACRPLGQKAAAGEAAAAPADVRVRERRLTSTRKAAAATRLDRQLVLSKALRSTRN